MDGRSLYNVGGDITGRGWELEAHDLMMMSQEKTLPAGVKTSIHLIIGSYWLQEHFNETPLSVCLR